MTDLKELSQYEIKWQEMKALVSEIQIKDKETSLQADKLLRSCNEIEKDIENQRVNMVKPLNDIVKTINSKAKDVSAPVLEAKTEVKRKIVAYNAELEKARRLEEARIETIINSFQDYKDQKDLEDYFLWLDKTDRDNPLVTAGMMRRIGEISGWQDEEMIEEEALSMEAEADLKAKQDAQSNKVKGIMTVTKWEIVDEEKVPRQACSSDSKKINALIKLGHKNIDGIRIREEKVVR